MKETNIPKSHGINNEYEYNGLVINGFIVLAVLLTVFPLCFYLLMGKAFDEEGPNFYSFVECALVIVWAFCLGGFFVQEPNESRVFVFFGKYKGSCRRQGMLWVNPFFSKKKISLRIRNMDIDPIKVNDKVGNPVLIGMVLVWKVSDTYRVVFDLDSSAGSTAALSSAKLDAFVRIQSDAALREVTGKFAYDPENGSKDELTLRDGGEQINDLLEHKINERLAMAGIEVVEARINYLAYAPEIAAVMLRRQQASAIISAREKIVEGAVSMVEMALKKIEEGGMVKLSESEKAAMVGNLLVVLCADEPATPMLNTTA